MNPTARDPLFTRLTVLRSIFSLSEAALACTKFMLSYELEGHACTHDTSAFHWEDISPEDIWEDICIILHMDGFLSDFLGFLVIVIYKF